MPTKHKQKSYPPNGGGYSPAAVPPSFSGAFQRQNPNQQPKQFGYYYQSSSPNSRMATPAGSSTEGNRRFDEQSSPSYSVEHLATFGYGSQFGLHSPTDGIRKLKQMELSQAVWAQKMILRLKSDSVVVEDENGDVVESFPMNLVADPSAHLSNDPRDVYNNLLVFVVNEDKQRKSATPTEMHIFQCVRISANDVVDDVRKFMSGRGSSVIPGRRETGFIHSNESFQQPVKTNGMYQGQQNRMDEELNASSLAFERDVNMLNRCFDDIERFVARIQQAALIQREMEKRRGARQQNAQIPPQFPTELEFHDILQKFKYCFNLLAKLKNHIHEPNAPELLHFLFTPFTIILDACNWGIGANVAQRVYNPPITVEAKTLLQNSLTSRESEVWMSLGDAWTVPAVFQQQNGSSSVPHFVQQSHSLIDSGPTVPTGNGQAQMDVLAGKIRHLAIEEERIKREKEELAKREMLLQQKERRIYEKEEELERISHATPDNDSPLPPVEHHRLRYSADSSYQPNYTGSSLHVAPPTALITSDDHVIAGNSDSPRQRAFLDDLKAKRARVVQVTYDRVGQNPKELTVTKSEFLEVMNDSKKWWECRNVHNRIGYVPHTIVTVVYDGMDMDGVGQSRNLHTTKPTRMMNGGISPARDRDVGHSPNGDIVGQYHHRPNQNRYRQNPDYNDEDDFSPPADIDYQRGDKRHSQSKPVPVVVYQPAVPSHKITSTGVQTTSLINHGVQTEESEERRFGQQSTAGATSFIPPAPSLPPPSAAPAANAKSNGATLLVERKERSNGYENGVETHGRLEATSRRPNGVTNSMDEKLKEELEQTIGRGRKKDVVNSVKPKEPSIDEFSSESDVAAWLLAKGFSPRTIGVLDGQSGATVFALSKPQLQQFCGSQEGALLYSKLLVEKSLSGYSTKSDAELKAILRARKGKSENGPANQQTAQQQQSSPSFTTVFSNNTVSAGNGDVAVRNGEHQS